MVGGIFIKECGWDQPTPVEGKGRRGSGQRKKLSCSAVYIQEKLAYTAAAETNKILEKDEK